MSNTCGNSVQSVWETARETCQYSSTEHSRLLYAWTSAYGNQPFIHSWFPTNSTFITQVKVLASNLLLTRLSTLSTAPTITKKKEYKEI